MTNEAEQRRNKGVVKTHFQRINTRRALLSEQAIGMGLHLYPTPFSRLWIEKDQVIGSIPERFFVEDYLDNKREPKLVEYRFKLPINNQYELVESLKSLDAFYYGISDIKEYAVKGTRGLVEFLEGMSLENLRSYTQDQIEGFIQNDQIDNDNEVREIAEKFKKDIDKER